MKKSRDWKLVERLIYWIIWSVIFGSPLIFGDFSDVNQRHLIIKGWIRIFPFFIIFIIHNLYLLPKLLLKEKPRVYIIWIIVLVFGVNYFFVYSTWFHEHLIQFAAPSHVGPGEEHGAGRGHGHGGGPMRWLFTPYIIYIYSIVLSVLIIGFNAALKYTSVWIRDEQSRKELEKENLNSKLTALQQQISPHFFMNTLNNIHALIDYNKEDAKEAIVRLSKMMRYLLYDSEHGKTTLRKEIEFLNSYIDLMRLRITEEIELKVAFDNDPPDVFIAPLLFITFLENAFKYGISYNEKSHIHVLLEINVDKIHFNIKNSKPHRIADKTDQSGIGIKNTRKRLDLLYNKNYVLNIYDRERNFEVDLVIPTTI
jgi:hypothetical protein